MANYTPQEFTQLVQDCLEHLTPQQLARDVGTDVKTINKWSYGSAIPAGHDRQRWGQKFQNHSMWDDL